MAVVEYHRITEDQAWRALWARHAGEGLERDLKGNAVAPVVDFDTHMVVAVFGGRSVNTWFMDARAIEELEDSVRVRVERHGYQTHRTADSVTPYGIYVVRRIEKPVRIELNVQSRTMEPPIWEEVARFGAGPHTP